MLFFGVWSQQAYLRASNTESNDWFRTVPAVDAIGKVGTAVLPLLTSKPCKEWMYLEWLGR
jgi:hypothetical protein